MKLTDFKALTFDCYGTLIDWETGIWNALQPLLSTGQLKFSREEALNLFAQFETEQERETPSLRYSSAPDAPRVNRNPLIFKGLP